MDKRGFESTTVKILTRASNMICVIILSVCLLIIIMPGTSVVIEDLASHRSVFESQWFTIPMIFIALVVLVALLLLLRNFKIQKVLKAQQDKSMLNMPLEQYGAETAAKAETPVQNYSNVSEGFMEVNNGANIAAAQEAQIKRQIDMNIAETAKYESLAREALQAGKEDDARIFIEKKQILEAARSVLDAAYNNVVNMRRMSDEFMGNVQSQTINVNTTVMRNGKIVNQTSYTGTPQSRMDIFKHMDSEGDRMLEEMTAMFAKLNTAASAGAGFNGVPKDEAEALAEKYAAQRNAAPVEENKNNARNKAVDEELARIKSDMGL